MQRTLATLSLIGVFAAASAHAAILYDNGDFRSTPTVSSLETGYTVNGTVANLRAATPQAVAGDFTVPAGGWTVDTATVYAYNSVTGGQTNPFDAAWVGIYNADPTGKDFTTAAPSLVYGGLGTGAANAFLSQAYTGVDRVNGNRRIHAVELNLGSTPLPAGHYWLAFALGSPGVTDATIAVVPVVPTPTGSNDLLIGRSPDGLAGWAPADGTDTDATTAGAPYEHAFRINGSVVVPEPATAGVLTAAATMLARRRRR
jgi:hypothetical protein